MKILFIDKQEKKVAGMGTYSQEVIRFLLKKGQMVVPLRFGDKHKKEEPKNTVLLPYLAGAKALYFIPNGKSLGVIKETIKTERPDVIHLNLGISPLDFYLPKLAHDFGIPIVGIFHLAFPRSQEISLGNLGAKSLFFSYLPCLTQLDKIITFSKTVADFLEDNKVKKEKIAVLPNAVDAKLYSPGRSHFKEKNRIKFAFLFLGRLDRQKNPDILIESFLQIHPPAEQKLILIGEGTIGSLGEEVRKKYRNHPQVTFIKTQTDTREKIDIIRSADVFVQPSSFEGMSFSLLETMAAGLAPISSNAGNHEDVIGNSGILIEHNKIKEQLPVALQIFSKNPHLGKNLGKRARKIILQKYDLVKQISNLIGIYQEVRNSCEKSPPQPSPFQRFVYLLGI